MPLARRVLNIGHSQRGIQGLSQGFNISSAATVDREIIASAQKVRPQCYRRRMGASSAAIYVLLFVVAGQYLVCSTRASGPSVKGAEAAVENNHACMLCCSLVVYTEHTKS